MSGKFAKKNNKSRKAPVVLMALLIVLVLGICAVVLLWPDAPENISDFPGVIPEGSTAGTGASDAAALPLPTAQNPETTEQVSETEESIPETTEDPSENTKPQSGPEETDPKAETTVPVPARDVYDLGYGLRINRIDSYAGIYMEDGSDEVVSGVLMISVTNHSEQDLQFARIRLTYADGEARFEATNLPAGATVILLEKNRLEFPGEEPQDSMVEEAIFFEKPMQMQADSIRIEGSNSVITVTNISGADIDTDIYIYYKNMAGEQYFGGITYRAKLSGGLKAGESATVMAKHYAPNMCAIVMVTTGN